jgi:hypothetical protein
VRISGHGSREPFNSRYSGDKKNMASRSVAILVGILAIAVSTHVWAGARLESLKPNVMVNSGEGYRTVRASTSVNLANGDQVMAGPGGHGRLVYPDGCVTQVNPGSVVTVGKCYRPMTAGLECDPSTDPKCLVPPPVAVTPWWLIGGAAAGIAVGICAAQCCFENCEPSRSP